VFERVAVDVDSDDLVPGRIHARERAVAAAEIEHSPPGPAHVAPKEIDAVRPREDEVLAPG
jgi:hypothetical protein